MEKNRYQEIGCFVNYPIPIALGDFLDGNISSKDFIMVKFMIEDMKEKGEITTRLSNELRNGGYFLKYPNKKELDLWMTIFKTKIPSTLL